MSVPACKNTGKRVFDAKSGEIGWFVIDERDSRD
jgi:hypothetical protein